MRESTRMLAAAAIVAVCFVVPLAAMTSGAGSRGEKQHPPEAPASSEAQFGLHFELCEKCDPDMHGAFREYLSLGPCNLGLGKSCERKHHLTVHGTRMVEYLSCCYKQIPEGVMEPPSRAELLDYIAQMDTREAVRFLEECHAEEDELMRRYVWRAVLLHSGHEEIPAIVRRHYVWETSARVREVMLAVANRVVFGDEDGPRALGLGRAEREAHRAWLREEAAPFEERYGSDKLRERIRARLEGRPIPAVAK